MQKITVFLNKEEWEALIDVSTEDHRPAQYQAEFILRQELKRRGFLLSSNSNPSLDNNFVSEGISQTPQPHAT